MALTGNHAFDIPLSSSKGQTYNPKLHKREISQTKKQQVLSQARSKSILNLVCLLIGLASKVVIPHVAHHSQVMFVSVWASSVLVFDLTWASSFAVDIFERFCIQWCLRAGAGHFSAAYAEARKAFGSRAYQHELHRQATVSHKSFRILC